MRKPLLSDVISHWNHMFEGMQESPQAFYASVEQAIQARNIPDAKFTRVDVAEGGILSAKRMYLRVWRKEHVIDICAAPFGNSFFISWWLSEIPSGCMALLLSLPFISLIAWWFARPVTYYKIDTAMMFQALVKSAVNEAIDKMTTAKGIRALSDTDRTPVMKDFFKK